MKNEIGIVMGGYVDENQKLMDRTELNRRIASIQKENEKLKYIIRETLWMAKRYADGRSTFAPSTFNECVHLLDELGLESLFTYNNGESKFANDGMLGLYNPETRKFEKE